MMNSLVKYHAPAAVILLSALLPGALASNETCVTPDCIKAASHILQTLHPDYKSMDPCNNFEQCMSSHIFHRGSQR